MWLLNSLIIAMAMYSKIPMPMADWNEKNMKYAMCFFPVVGVVTGGAVYLAGRGLLQFTSCGQVLFAVVMTLIPVLITGGIHLDGFADTVDALSSYGDREKKLEILKDPHTGAFAIIGLCCYFLCCAGVWSEVTMKQLPVIACIFVFSRAMSGISVVSFQAAKNSGLLRTFQDSAQKRRVRVVLILWAVMAAGVMIKLSVSMGIATCVTGIITFLYYYWFSKKKFGGITGDLAGYFLQVCELAMITACMIAGKVV